MNYFNAIDSVFIVLTLNNMAIPLLVIFSNSLLSTAIRGQRHAKHNGCQLLDGVDLDVHQRPSLHARQQLRVDVTIDDVSAERMVEPDLDVLPT